jgi:hypothetical protein
MACYNVQIKRDKNNKRSEDPLPRFRIPPFRFTELSFNGDQTN